MRRRTTYLCLALTALVPLAAPAAADAKKKSAKPKITRVAPMRLRVGSKLTIRGKGFSSTKRRNTIVFRASNGRTAFAKPSRATHRKLRLKVPRAVARIVQGKKTVRFKLRVLVKHKFSKFTSKRLSPIVLGSLAGGGSCADDGDLLSRALELRIGTDPCLKDTDGDGVEDGYEYQSAKDLNNDEHQVANRSLPYPGKRPYPNPLDPSDANTDFDGDSLTLKEEQKLWHYAGPHSLHPLSYSDGMQYSLSRARSATDDRRVPTQPAAGYGKQASFLSWAASHGYRNVRLYDGAPWYDSTVQHVYGLLDANRSGTETGAEKLYYDLYPDGYLSDDERDEDADGLTNYDELHGRMTPGYWTSCYKEEKAPLFVPAGTDPTASDTDGDGIRDGADDQDHDDVPNVVELSRYAASGLDDRKSECKARDNIGGSNFAVSGGPLPDGGMIIDFRNELGGIDVAQMTANGTGLTGGTSPTVTVQTIRNGGGGTSEKQAFVISGAPDGGGFTLTLGTRTTPQIAYNADKDGVAAALESIYPANPLVNHPNAYGRVNPFNACLPHAFSRTCVKHPSFENSGAPFDDSINWLSLN